MRRPAKYFGKKFEMGVVANRLISVWGDVPDSGHALAKNMEHFFRLFGVGEISESSGALAKIF